MKKYTPEEVVKIIAGNCNNFCAHAGDRRWEDILVSFMKFISSMDSERMCQREIGKGGEVLERIEQSSSLFPPKTRDIQYMHYCSYCDRTLFTDKNRVYCKQCSGLMELKNSTPSQKYLTKLSRVRGFKDSNSEAR